MKNVLVLMLILSSIGIKAQNIRGKVFMEKDKSPAQFASVGLYQMPDSNLVTGVITLTDGGYQFEDVKPGNYRVKVNFLGYVPAAKTVAVQPGKGEFVVDSIFLTETTTDLKEVTFVGERLKGKEMVDRTVYSIPPIVAKASTNGYDILKKIPQVNVDFQNNVTLNGSSNFIIQVDGKQRDKEFLAKLLPGDIETVEIVSNPSGKYEGNIDGVINIILKKEARYGVNGNVSLTYKPINKVTAVASGSLDYAMGKITFYVTGFTFKQNLNINSTNTTHYKVIDSIASLSSNGGINVTSSSVNTGFDYYMNDKNNLSFNVSYKPIRQDVDMTSQSFLYKNGAPENTIASITGTGLKSDEATFNLFYKKTFKQAIREFTADASFYTFSSNDNNNYTNTRYLYNDVNPLSSFTRLEENINDRNYFSTKLNYVQPIGMSAKIEAGYQLYYQKLKYNFEINQSAVNDPFNYEELRNSAYAGFTINKKKIGFQTILRVENSHISADSVTTPNYACLLPSANFQYKFSANHNLKLTYNRRINRPGIYDMYPYQKTSQSNAVTQGNPNLKPDYRDRLQLTYTWNFGSNYFSPNVYYEFLSNKVAPRYQITKSPIDGAITTFSRPYNLQSGYEFGGGASAMLWYVNLNARVFRGHFDSYSDASITLPGKDYSSYSITSYAFKQFGKNKKTTAFAFLSYNGVNIDAQSKTYSVPFYGVGGQHQIKDHTIGMFFLLPGSKNIKLTRTETETDYYHVQNIVGFDVSYYIQVMYTYKFNKGRNVKKLDRKVEVESDSKSQGIGR